MTTEQLRQLNSAIHIRQRQTTMHESQKGRNGTQDDQDRRDSQQTRPLPGGNADVIRHTLGGILLGLGLAGLILPRQMTKVIGIRDQSNHRNLIRAAGARKLVSGVGLLLQLQSNGLEKVRMGGEMIDLALLGLALNTRHAQRGKVALALATAAGITITDYLYRRQRNG